MTYMEIEDVDKPTTKLVLVPQLRAMLDSESYHYCADCHSHCRQTILAVEAAKEATKACDALREALTQAADTADRASLVQDRSVGIIKQTCALIASDLRAALSLVDVNSTDEEVK